MPSSRSLVPGLLLALTACSSSRSPGPRPVSPTASPTPFVAPPPATNAAPPSPGSAQAPVGVLPAAAVPPPPAIPVPVAKPADLRPAVPAAPLPEAGPRTSGGPATPSARPAPTPAAAPPPPATTRGGPPPASPAVPTVAPSAPTTGWPTTLTEFLAELRRRARSGAEPEFAPVTDLLDEIAAAVPTAGAELSISRMPDVEAREKAKFGSGTGWCTLAHFVEPGADATAMRASYLDIDRVHEYTGKPGASMLRREGDVTIGRTDAMRKVLAFEFGARWTFRAKSLDRGTARLVVTAMEPAADTLHMLTTRGVIVAFPARDGLFVAEANASLVDFEVPPLLKAPAESLARKEMLARVAGIRAHWREYVK